MSNPTVVVSTFRRVWKDIDTPQGPDMQVRWAGHNMVTGEVTLEYREKPTVAKLEELGISREESDRGVF